MFSVTGKMVDVAIYW